MCVVCVCGVSVCRRRNRGQGREVFGQTHCWFHFLLQGQQEEPKYDYSNSEWPLFFLCTFLYLQMSDLQYFGLFHLHICKLLVIASYISIIYKRCPETGTLQPLDACLPPVLQTLPVPPAAG